VWKDKWLFQAIVKKLYPVGRQRYSTQLRNIFNAADERAITWLK
jgi:hypothetical protein